MVPWDTLKGLHVYEEAQDINVYVAAPGTHVNIAFRV
jgi:hypothetical protein